MSKKLQGNGLFESSRMMLPEHKEAYLEHQQNLKKKTRPLLDGQETELFAHMISESMFTGREIKIVLFDMFEEKIATGRVIDVDQQKRAIKLANVMDRQLIPFDNIITLHFI
ncbi:YolD-like family protein [Brevibacillus sp. NPDC058079]|uniref:YolD-like family protein n=1 Tax=Brevibacillus sp. NPDC058079 TaxID=3346330 RepID=UPI002EA2D945|nr:YolD-like family protein [Bacillus thuringiensis]